MLSVEGLDVAYGGSQVLWGVDLEVPNGSVVCLMGRNGVGKTTLLRAAMGLLPARAGRVTFDGADVTRWSPDRRARAGVGYVPQGREIFPHLTVAENLRMAGLGCGRAGGLDEALELVSELRELLSRKGGVPRAASTDAGDRPRVLTKPRLLMLDEPTEGFIVDHPRVEEAIRRIKTELGWPAARRAVSRLCRAPGRLVCHPRQGRRRRPRRYP